MRVPAQMQLNGVANGMDAVRDRFDTSVRSSDRYGNVALMAALKRPYHVV